jgi:hypothetical protein
VARLLFCYNARPWNESWSIAKKAFILVAMNMKKPDGLVNSQASQKMCTNTLQNVDNILTDDVVNQHDSLLGVNPGGLL